MNQEIKLELRLMYVHPQSHDMWLKMFVVPLEILGLHT